MRTSGASQTRAAKVRPKVLQELIEGRLFDGAGDYYEVRRLPRLQPFTGRDRGIPRARGDAGTLGNHKRWHIVTPPLGGL